jgi:hypothetical protein
VNPVTLYSLETALRTAIYQEGKYIIKEEFMKN